MQCSKCGTILEEGMLFCPKCGAMAEVELTLHQKAMPEENPVAQEMPEKPEEKAPEESPELPATKQRKISPVMAWGMAAVLMVAVVLALFVFRSKPEPSPSTYTSALDTYVAVSYGLDFSRIRELAPEAYWAHLEKNGTNLELKMKRIGLSFLSESHDRQVYCGDDLKVFYEITETKTIEGTLADQFKQLLQEKCGISPESVGETRSIKYFLQFSGAQLTQNSNEQRGYIVCIDGQWYLAGNPGGEMMFLPTTYEGGIDLEPLPR